MGNPKPIRRVAEEWRIDVHLPDPTSEKKEAAMKKLKEKGCSEFVEQRYYDIINDVEALVIQGFKLDTSNLPYGL